MSSSRVKADLKIDAVFILTLPELVKVEDNKHTHFAMEVSTSEEILQAADNSYHMNVVMPYNELVMKTLMAHSLYSKLFIIAAPKTLLVTNDCLAKRFRIETARLFPVSQLGIVNQTLNYVASSDQ